MDYSAIKKMSLKLFLAFLGLTAAIAIISVLIGDFGNLQGKILITCFAVSAASICSMSCAAYIERNKHVQLGLVGICLSIISAIFLITGIWTEIESEEYWKTMITFTVAAISLAFTFLLTLTHLRDKYRLVQPIFCVSVGVLALQIVIAVWGEIDNEGYVRAMAVVAILVGLLTLAIPILAKMQQNAGHTRQKLILDKVTGDLYRDSLGKEYRVSVLESRHKPD